jgi:hypothetical protein
MRYDDSDRVVDFEWCNEIISLTDSFLIRTIVLLLTQVMKQEWYRNFIKEGMSDQLLFEVLAAANYMEIQPLLDLACLRVTFEIQGKDAEAVCWYSVMLFECKN